MDRDVALVDLKEKESGALIENRGDAQGEKGMEKNKPKTPAQYLEELKNFMDTITSPHEGRIQELKELIRKGRLMTKEAIHETAQKLADQFLGRQD